jgi:hypothetical protein
VKAQEAMLAVLDTTVIAELAAQLSVSRAPTPGAPPLLADQNVIGNILENNAEQNHDSKDSC